MLTMQIFFRKETEPVQINRLKKVMINDQVMKPKFKNISGSMRTAYL